MVKSFESQVLTSILIETVESLLSQKTALVPSQPADASPQEIIEYEGRMRASGMSKFNATSYIATTSFFLNQDDAKRHKAKGAMVLYINSEVADKLFKGLGFTLPYDEDDESMMKLCGQFTTSVIAAFKERLATSGYPTLVSSDVLTFKNSVPQGIEFSPDQNEKQEISFYYFKLKSVVVEVTLAPIPKK